MDAPRRLLALGILAIAGAAAFFLMQGRPVARPTPVAAQKTPRVDVARTVVREGSAPAKETPPAAAPSPAETRESAVEGTVTAEGKVPSEATVFAFDTRHPFTLPRSVRVDREGKFSLSLPEGEWSVHAEGTGVVCGPHGVWLRDGQRKADKLGLTLDRSGAIAGSVLDPDGRPLAGAHVLCLSTEVVDERSFVGGISDHIPRMMYAAALSDEHGQFRMEVAPGDLELHACAEGFASGGAEADVPADRTIEVELRLSLARRLLVRVCDTAHRPVPGASVTVVYEGSKPPGPYPARFDLTAGDDGSVTIDGLAPEQAQAIARADGYIIGSAYADASKDSVEVQLLRSSLVRGRVVLHGGAPCTDARVTIGSGNEMGIDPSYAGERATDGTFELKKVTPGHHVVYAKAEGSAVSRSREFDVAEGETVEGVVVEIQSAATLEGRVLDEKTGEAIPKASIARVQESKSGSGATYIYADDQGRFSLKDLPPGPLKLRIGGEGHSARTFVLDIQEGVPLQQDFRIGRGSHARVHVLPSDKALLEKAIVQFGRLTQPFPDEVGWRHPEPDRYESNGLEKGTWWVSAQVYAEDGKVFGRMQWFDVDGESDVDLELPLTDVPVARGAVRKGGAPLARQGVLFVGTGTAAGAMFGAMTDENGRAEVRGLAPGEYYIVTVWPWGVETDATTGLTRPAHPANAPVVRITDPKADASFDVDFPAQ